MQRLRLGKGIFDRGRLRVLPVGQRVNDLDVSVIRPLERSGRIDGPLEKTAARIRAATAGGNEVIMMIGAHVLRAGVQRYIIDLLRKGRVTCLAMNGACVIHDFEFALIGATTESVARYVAEGKFGLWTEPGRINDIVNGAFSTGIGMGEAVGRAIDEGDFPYKDISVLRECYRLGIPATVHIGIGYDIIHELPNFDGAASGAASYLDFLRFADSVTGLDGGVIMNFGSAVMAPEVFLKALSMARNVAHQEGRSISRFTSLVCDLRELPANTSTEPSRKCEGYYFRPWKTMLIRSVSGGGESFYVRGDHAETVPALWTALEGGD